MSYLLNALVLLVTLAFDAVVVLFLVRLAAEAGRADFRNPLSQFVYRTTNPVLAPIRRVLPNWRRINLAAASLRALGMFALIASCQPPSAPDPGSPLSVGSGAKEKRPRMGESGFWPSAHA